MEEFDTLDSNEKTIAILGGRWWPQASKQEGVRLTKRSYVTYGIKVMSARICWRCPQGVGTVFRLDWDAGSMANE